LFVLVLLLETQTELSPAGYFLFPTFSQKPRPNAVHAPEKKVKIIILTKNKVRDLGPPPIKEECANGKTG